MGSATVSEDTRCSWQGCQLGGVIKANDIKVWGQRGPTAGLPYHPACIHPAREEREREEARREREARETTPAPVPPPVVPAPVVPAPVVPAPVVPTPANLGDLGDAAGKLAEAMAIIAGASRPALDREAVESIVRETLEAAKDTFGVRRIELQRWDGKKIDCGVQHRDFPKLLELIARATRFSLYIWGPAGTGKSQAVINAAGALGLECSLISMGPQTPASKLEGFIDAQGRFTSPDFYKRYTGGGVFLIDEVDNMSPALATTLNSAIANRIASFPNGDAKMHEDFRLCLTANTSGRGPTAQYQERRKLDGATIDRARFFHWAPDQDLELVLALSISTPERDEAVKRWARWVQAVREYVSRPDCGITAPVYCGMRAIMCGAEEVAQPYSWSTIQDMAEAWVFKALPTDQTQRILAAVPLPQGVL